MTPRDTPAVSSGNAPVAPCAGDAGASSVRRPSFLQDFTELVAGRLTGTGGRRWCAITLLRDRRAVTAVCSGPEARELDALQNSFTQGPCMTAIREKTVIRAGDLRTDDRWPEYQGAAVAQGVRSVLGSPSICTRTPGPG